MLTPLVVVVMDKLFYCINKLLVGFKVVEIIHLALQDAPETFHGTVVDASANSGHALLHILLVQLCLKLFACVLKSSVAVKQWMCVGILLDSKIKSFKDKLVVVAFANRKGDDISAS